MKKIQNKRQAITLLIILIALGGVIMYGHAPIKRNRDVIPSFMKPNTLHSYETVR